jgi:CDP-diglyceride synthetase
MLLFNKHIIFGILVALTAASVGGWLAAWQYVSANPYRIAPPEFLIGMALLTTISLLTFVGDFIFFARHMSGCGEPDG